ncbi:sulfite exporter TauE/SafE family protein [Mesorhizobium sp. ZC-5]|uniref:sulfite exporter TauE/SafE family protein n=1 Tax=Mesorhizobium sp. ZC-5 TaxID=2986066 RepID=UPI0021E6F802|nr:sulfite exporter TauE/SafE family protein [Mesorhizobium sp. ZC-5]MCV3242238.1 sulfite exporter TauE/SafE family protein [Mesorhizobium sp. ZC-5]
MQEFILFAVVGFLAQAVDGALGMAYGVISSTTLLAFGVPPAHASAAVHGAEMFTTAASGSAHLYHRNIDWKLFWRLAPFGIIGGCLGAYVLTGIDASVMKPVVTTYLALIGAWLLFRSFRKIPSNPVPRAIVAPLGLGGGFLDAAGGGGWGPIVTTGLLGAGGQARFVIGTVNASEFLITLSVSLTFLIALLTGHWEDAGDLTKNLAAVAGLVVGGVCAAPLAGLMVRRLREKVLLRLVGTLIVLLAGWQTAQLLGWA